VGSRLGAMYPYVPKQPGWNKRLRAALSLIKRAIRLPGTDTAFWFDNHWVVDSTPVECGRSRPTVKRSDMAGWAGYGYRADQSRFFWRLRLFLARSRVGPARQLWVMRAQQARSSVVVISELDIP
jgi:hypothetical protein